MTALLYFVPLFKAQLGRFALAMLLSLVTLTAGASLLGTAGWFITAAAVSTAGVSFNIFGPSALIRGFSFIRILARYGERLVGHNATLKLLSDIRTWLFGRLFLLVPLAVSGIRHGDLVSRLVADVDTLDTVFLVSVAPIVAALIVGSVVTATLHAFLPVAAGIYALMLLLSVLGVPAIYLVLSRRAGEAIGLAAAEVRIAALDGIEGHRDLAAAGATDWSVSQLIASATKLSRARVELGETASLASAAVQLLAAVGTLGVLWFGLYAVHDGQLAGSVLVGLLLAVVGSFEATAVVVRGVAKLGVAAVAARRLKSLATQQPTMQDSVTAVQLPPGGDIVFDHVSFGYDAARPVVHDLSLNIRSGSRIAILGPSGAGKSTIVALLLRLHDPQSGSVYVAGTDLRAVTQTSIHARVALLAQDSPVFMDSVRCNLLIGRAGATDAELWVALGAARVDEFVRGLPHGLDTFLGEAGRTISAGQARRLCLARSLLSASDILVLDEPTSGLDGENEAAFLADLATATAGRTTILIAHATLPVGAVDRTYLIEDGRLSGGA